MNEKIQLPSSKWSNSSSDGEVKLCKLQDIDGVFKFVHSLRLMVLGPCAYMIQKSLILRHYLFSQTFKVSFKRLFWAQQFKAATEKNCKQMTWHPTMIQWSLYVKSKSTTGYNALRKVIKLSSDRTLRDYTHVYDPNLGFQVDVDKQV